jgi:protein-disulfide isomerase
MKRYLPVLIIVGVLVAAFGGGALLMKSSSNETDASLATRPLSTGAPAQPAGPTAPAGASAPAAPARPAGDAPTRIRGVASAPVTLEEFSDFQCPTCGALHSVLKQLLAKYPSQLRIAFRHYPLRQIHRHAAEAALAAEAAGQQGKFWEMHDLLYEKQKEWSEVPDALTLFRGYAQTLGLDAERFTRDMTGTASAMHVASDERLAQSLGITGTPTFYLNGRQLPFEQSNTLDKLSAAVDRELAAVKK